MISNACQHWNHKYGQCILEEGHLPVDNGLGVFYDHEYLENGTFGRFDVREGRRKNTAYNETPTYLRRTTMKKQIRSTKKFVSRHRVAIAVIATTTVLMTLQFRNAKELNAFLKEHDLFDKYYAFEEI